MNMKKKEKRGLEQYKYTRRDSHSFLAVELFLEKSSSSSSSGNNTTDLADYLPLLKPPAIAQSAW